MKKALITGATGNIGKEVIKFLANYTAEIETIAAVRNIEIAKKTFSNLTSISFRKFDFENLKRFESAFEAIDILFLLRPPHISDVDKYFKPLLISAQKNGIQKIVFLSVQGAEKSKVIPHNKIESLIKTLGFQYVFVRPSYFMQNLTTTLLPEIIQEKCITLPSKNAKFNWIDVENIGEISALFIKKFDQYHNKAYEITGTENLSFPEVVEIMSTVLKTKIRFQNINPFCFYKEKKKEGFEKAFAIVMTILHFLPRLQKEPHITEYYTLMTKKKPTTISVFLKREQNKFSLKNQ